ncbi:MAG: HAMP domain-containing histidine kinase [Planctomycetes bacterium]|nr:HAMP domain-containing histidine kinase [Planctomycetota bacterium]
MRGLFALPRRRIGIQLALALLLVSLSPLLLSGFLILGLIEESLSGHVQATQDALLSASSLMTQEYLRLSQAKLATVAGLLCSEELVRPRADPRADLVTRAALTARLEGVLQPSELFLELDCYALGEQALARSQVAQSPGAAISQSIGVLEVAPLLRPAEPRYESQDPLLLASRQGSAFVAPAIRYEGDVPYASASVPIVTGGRVIGSLVARVSLLPLRHLFRVFARGAPGDTAVVLADAEGTSVVTEGGLPGPDAFETTAVVPGRGWTLSVRQARGAAFAVLTEARHQARLWFGLAVLLSLALALIFARRIVSPVHALSRAVDAMAGGDLSTRSSIRREDELGQLARAFDRMAESLQKLDELKSDFVSHVSHELRTPLTSIKVSLSNLQDGLIGPIEERQAQVLSRIRQDVDRLIRMVNELLEAARLEAGRVSLVPARCDLFAIASQAVESLRPLADRKQVALSIVPAAAPGAGAWARGEASQLHEVVANLVDNAVKFTPADGAVRVEVRSADAWVECAVTDSGPGIEPARLSRLFEKFSSARGPGDARPSGAGLGLWISRRIIELHGGTIGAENLPNGGASFLMRVPAWDNS